MSRGGKVLPAPSFPSPVVSDCFRKGWPTFSPRLIRPRCRQVKSLGLYHLFDDKGCGRAFSAQSDGGELNVKIEGQLGKDRAFREKIEKLKTDLTQKAKKKYFITIV